ncbi:hypothetical protein Mal4_53570 [Maioricimonas rarisocia]|uniref:Uncharacterized protein n=1 Tax=Maioricimonas rarisocia TaxID=2528026 RepID=A0A517ZET7_9PLAN|nr:hypothetical protein [Maioricimonas rarisocia]QDU40992.1 hypothetical protein Mal4_53570 [Maioricimonas rarisocia]
MSDVLHMVSLRVGELFWGWTLALPRDLTILLTAVLSTLVVLLVRRLLTDQPLLRDIRADERTLRQLIRKAKRTGEEEVLTRYRNTHSAVMAMKLSQEFRVLPIALLLILVTVAWGNERLSWLPLRRGEPVILELEVPRVHAGRIVHLVPQPELSSRDGWLRQLDEQTEPLPRARTEWEILIEDPPAERLLTIRLNDQTLEHPVSVDVPPGTDERVRRHADGVTTTLHLKRYRPFGLPVPWPVAYGVWCVVFYLAGRRLLGIV